MGFTWVLSDDYRSELKRDHLNRNVLLAWIEYFLAAVCFFGWVVLILYASHILVEEIV